VDPIDVANISLRVHSFFGHLLAKYLQPFLQDSSREQTNHYICIKMCVGTDLYYSECNARLNGERVNSI
jgi:hypothetical protein